MLNDGIVVIEDSVALLKWPIEQPHVFIILHYLPHLALPSSSCTTSPCTTFLIMFLGSSSAFIEYRLTILLGLVNYIFRFKPLTEIDPDFRILRREQMKFLMMLLVAFGPLRGIPFSDPREKRLSLLEKLRYLSVKILKRGKSWLGRIN